MEIGDKLIVVDDILEHEIPLGTEVIVVEIYESGDILAHVCGGIRHRVLINDEYRKK